MEKFFMYIIMKEMLYEVRCLKSNEDMILALAGQFKQLFLGSWDNCLNCPASARIISSFNIIIMTFIIVISLSVR